MINEKVINHAFEIDSTNMQMSIDTDSIQTILLELMRLRSEMKRLDDPTLEEYGKILQKYHYTLDLMFDSLSRVNTSLRDSYYVINRNLEKIIDLMEGDEQ